jgi:hypothetical protein
MQSDMTAIIQTIMRIMPKPKRTSKRNPGEWLTNDAPATSHKWQASDADFARAVEVLGCKPTRAQWTAAGFPYVDDRHATLVDYKPLIAVNYGGGTDSTGMLIAAYYRGIRPDIIVFADTGSEMPHTYAFLPIFDAWLKAHGMPGITVVRWIREDGTFEALHDWCERFSALPSRAYGKSGCTGKWKQWPLNCYIDNHPDVVAAHARGERVEKWVGYDFSEDRRIKNLDGKPDPYLWHWRAPLAEWRIDRQGCKDLIALEGLPLPGKSSCFICPSMKRKEVEALKNNTPDLHELAIHLERKAILAGNDGMGGRGLGMGTGHRWSEPPPEQIRIFGDDDMMPCGCHDRRPTFVAPLYRTRAYKPRPSSRLAPWFDQIGHRPHVDIAREAGVLPSTVYQMWARKTERPNRSLLR